MRYTLRFIGMINKTEKKHFLWLYEGIDGIYRQERVSQRQCSWDQEIVCVCVCLQAGAGAGVYLLEIIVVTAISACERACMSRHTRERVQTIWLWNNKYSAMAFINFNTSHAKMDSLQTNFVTRIIYVCWMWVCGRDGKTRTVISQLWKSFVWLFSFRLVFFSFQIVFTTTMSWCYLRFIQAHKKYMLHALSMLLETERTRETKNAIHYNRTGSKMLRLMEINGFVRYVLFCAFLCAVLVCFLLWYACEYNCWFSFSLSLFIFFSNLNLFPIPMMNWFTLSALVCLHACFRCQSEPQIENIPIFY